VVDISPPFVFVESPRRGILARWGTTAPDELGAAVEWEWDLIARLLVAAGLGAVVGLEREASDQPAGLRTHLAVALGAGLFGVISTAGFLEFETTQRASNIQFDVTRVASMVASGIGFIGAGLIFRQGTTVRNLTTAASLWVTAAIGLSCGVGDFAPAIATTLVMLAALALLRIPRNWVRTHLRPEREELRVVLRPGTDEEPLLQALRGLDGVHLDSFALEKDAGAYVVIAHVHGRSSENLRVLLNPLARLDVVTTMQIGADPRE
jgi:putative Mg2+ transporter-C (MgtC) family protein